MSPIEELREAARLMRERAQMATPSPWRESGVDGNRYAALVADQPHPDRMKGGGWQWDEGYGGCLIGESLMATDRAYIASWHPAVALAVADWLDAEATIWDHLDALRIEVSKTKGAVISIPYSSQNEALKLARTYLGTTP